jgi:DUF4097 and DUF4098 domain-containing protein YvlB
MFEMKLNVLKIGCLMVILALGAPLASAQNAAGKGKGQGSGVGMGKGEGKGQGEGVGKGQGEGDVEESSDDQDPVQISEQSINTTETVNVTLSTKGGKITVHGWDRKEVRVQTDEPGLRIQLKRSAGEAASSSPAARLEVLFSEDPEDDPNYEACGEDNDIRLDVPRGATVYLRTQDGDVEVEEVAEAHIETVGGAIDARRISKALDATSVGGDVSLEEASGRARLNSMGGSVIARDLRPLDPSDFLKAKAVSGDVVLDRVGLARVEASSISGELKLVGPLARGGNYDFTTTTGDVSFILPTESSFKLNARVSEGGEIVTEFPLIYRRETSPQAMLQAGRLVGTYGGGDATINLISFSGTLRLRKQ